MVRLTKIYTRGGDKGQTSLVDGSRLPKHAIRIEAYGTVDEASSVIGIARLHVGGDIDAALSRIQNDLFDLGADLATPGTEMENALRVQPSQVEWLEQQIDAINAGMKPLNSFILPGGSPASAYLHLARTVVRRAERMTTAAAEQEPINPVAIQYLNRLSDYMFVLARHLNDNGEADVLWVPGANR